MDEKVKFETFTEFCDKAEQILNCFYDEKINWKDYKKYIYEEHKFSDNEERDQLIKDKCWCWMMSREYEPMKKNDLYCVLGQLKKGR